ncbi:hypothetical protein phiK7A1_073 [Pseudomonas phage phiK7A1]|uniref:Phage neck terminator protein gp12-like domain-containing protein n=1 Tax=Pseudomonas phage phiK7A1 TaxID=2759194 RepID=A0A7H0XFS1_9CAUD|nr:hypothetical protein phiK7A1_073 [Pseudomonas phage phiK7A1]
MNIYQSLEDGVYNYVHAMFPTWRKIFAYGNGPEVQTPYLVIDVKKMDAIGRSYNSSSQHIDDNNQSFTTTIQNYEAHVRFEFVGKYDVNTELAEMAQQLEFALRTQRGYEEQKRNNLSLMKYNAIRRIPVRRETDTYMYYQLDVVFGYVVSITEVQDYIITLGIDGVYHDAGREPDHIIETSIEINP